MKKSDIWHVRTCGCFVSEEQILFIQSIVKFDLPRSYINFVRVCDGGLPKKEDFEYYNSYENEYSISGIGSFLSLNNYPEDKRNILSIWQDPPEFFPEGLVAFADVGCGDLICFDYRKGKDNPDPPIVYWDHGAEIKKSVSFIANNFEEFISILREPEDYFGDEDETEKEEE